MIIVSNIKAVDRAIFSIDADRTVCATIKIIAGEFELGFENGGTKVTILFQRGQFASR
jgi:hypothetical protein